MAEDRFKEPIIVPVGTSMGDLTRLGEYSYIPGTLFRQAVLKTPLHFFPRLETLGRHMRGSEARSELRRRFGNEWRPADPWNHVAFAHRYPEVQTAAVPDPIVSVGGVIKVGKFDRVVSTYWEPYTGRKLYLLFESAWIGPRVQFLLVRDVPLASA